MSSTHASLVAAQARLISDGAAQVWRTALEDRSDRTALQELDAGAIVDQDRIHDIATTLGIRIHVRIAWDDTWRRHDSEGPIRRLNHPFCQGGDPQAPPKGHFEPILSWPPPSNGGVARSAPSPSAHLRVAANTNPRLPREALMARIGDEPRCAEQCHPASRPGRRVPATLCSTTDGRHAEGVLG